MPELATREFWKDLQPIPDCFKPDAKPEVYLRNAPTEDERLYVPFTETVKSRPLWISPSENRWCDILMATSAGLVNRHYHPHEVFAYTISGKWGYLEHDWTATAGDIEYLATALRRHAGAEGVAKAGQGQDVEFDQLLFPRPFLVDEGAGGTDPGIVNQQVDLSFALFQFVQQP